MTKSKNMQGHTKVKAVCTSMTGEIRENNEDNYYFNSEYRKPDESEKDMTEPYAELIHVLEAEVTGKWVAVFDGIGGLPRGEMASYIAARTLAEVEQQGEQTEELIKKQEEETNYKDKLWKTARAMNSEIEKWKQEQKIKNMGTTMAALKFSEHYIFGMSLGDSRIYRLRNGKLEQLSTDHTYRYPGHIRSVLTGYLGTESEEDFHKMDLYQYEYQKGDKYLLCTDGVTDMLKDSVMEELLQLPLEEAQESLIDEVLRMGAEDNATAIIAEICG